MFRQFRRVPFSPLPVLLFIRMQCPFCLPTEGRKSTASLDRASVVGDLAKNEGDPWVVRPPWLSKETHCGLGTHDLISDKLHADGTSFLVISLYASYIVKVQLSKWQRGPGMLSH